MKSSSKVHELFIKSERTGSSKVHEHVWEMYQQFINKASKLYYKVTQHINAFNATYYSCTRRLDCSSIRKKYLKLEC